jgi:septal ring factor EnvC (AmiA/AmiB activator)
MKIGAFLIFLFLFVSPVIGDETDDALKKLETIKNELKQKKKSIKQTERRERSILAIIDGLDKEIAELEKEEFTLREEYNKKKRESSVLQEELDKINMGIKNREKRLSERLVALFKIQQWGYLPALFKIDDLSNFMINYKFLNILVKNDRDLIDELRSDFGKKKEYLEELNRIKVTLAKQESDLLKKKENLILKRDNKNVILTKIRKEKVLYHSAIKELEESTAMIEKMLNEFKAGNESGDAEFISRRGQLKMPVEGKIIKSFGKEIDPRFHTVIYRKGIVIKAEENSYVRSIFSGRVAFAGTFSGYGNLIIIKHGENYYSVYARLSELYKKEGDKIDSGEVIGRTGASGLFGDEGLYFELRRGGTPLDPELWFSKN